MIKINDSYYIDAEKYDYSAHVIYNSKTKDGNPTKVDKVIGYYNSVLGALKAIKEYDIHNSISNGELSLTEAISTIEKANATFLECIDNLY